MTADGADILDRVHAFLGRFVSYPGEPEHVAHTLWIAHTHLMDVWESTPRIAFLSPEPASGKSRALEITELLVPNPLNAVNASPAYLFRKVGLTSRPPTILYDEIDTVFGPRAKENEEIRGFLNAGHRRSGVFGRCAPKTMEPVESSAYCAVAVAGLGGLPDTILSRSVIIRMKRRAPGERVEQFRRRIHERTGNGLRSELATWARLVAGDLDGNYPDMPDGIEDRDADIWESLLAVAAMAGGDWLERAQVTAVTLVTSSRESSPSLGIRLLADCHLIFGEDTETISTVDLLAGLTSLTEAPWGDLRGKPLDARGLAQRLRPYDIHRTTNRQGEIVTKGYRRDDFFDAWARYLPSLSVVPQESVTEVTPVTPTAERNGQLPLDACCRRCGAGPWMVDESGTAWCETHAQGRAVPA